MAFEDSPHGATAAKNAGLYCVIVPNGVTKNLLFTEYDLKLESLSQLKLKEVLKRVGLGLAESGEDSNAHMGR